jgi:hypothetical protein
MGSFAIPIVMAVIGGGVSYAQTRSANKAAYNQAVVRNRQLVDKYKAEGAATSTQLQREQAEAARQATLARGAAAAALAGAGRTSGSGSGAQIIGAQERDYEINQAVLGENADFQFMFQKQNLTFGLEQTKQAYDAAVQDPLLAAASGALQGFGAGMGIQAAGTAAFGATEGSLFFAGGKGGAGAGIFGSSRPALFIPGFGGGAGTASTGGMSGGLPGLGGNT